LCSRRQVTCFTFSCRCDRNERSFTQSLRRQQDEAYQESLLADQLKEVRRREILEAERQEQERVRQEEEERTRKKEVRGKMLVYLLLSMVFTGMIWVDGWGALKI
jgi:hypothetical protein